MNWERAFDSCKFASFYLFCCFKMLSQESFQELMSRKENINSKNLTGSLTSFFLLDYKLKSSFDVSFLQSFIEMISLRYTLHLHNILGTLISFKKLICVSHQSNLDTLRDQINVQDAYNFSVEMSSWTLMISTNLF